MKPVGNVLLNNMYDWLWIFQTEDIFQCFQFHFIKKEFRKDAKMKSLNVFTVLWNLETDEYNYLKTLIRYQGTETESFFCRKCLLRGLKLDHVVLALIPIF